MHDLLATPCISYPTGNTFIDFRFKTAYYAYLCGSTDLTQKKEEKSTTTVVNTSVKNRFITV